MSERVGLFRFGIIIVVVVVLIVNFALVTIVHVADILFDVVKALDWVCYKEFDSLGLALLLRQNDELHFWVFSHLSKPWDCYKGRRLDQGRDA